MTKKARVIRLSDSGQWDTRACLARAAGVSREYVRQIVDMGEAEVIRPKSGKTLRWPCPDCGEEVERWPSTLQTYRMPAHCVKCAWGYCRNGHRRPKGTRCPLCLSAQAGEVIG